MKIISAILVFCFVSIISFSQCAKDAGIKTYQPSAEEIDNLKYLREEELLAGDVYEYLSGLYDIPVFRNISKSEDVHTDRIRMLLERYRVEDPAADHVAGNFENKDLQEMYNALVMKGSQSMDSAIIVGLMIEEKDIMDLQEALDHTIRAEDIKAVYIALRRGSTNHLRAFHGHAEARGLNYSPRFLERERFMEIIQE